MSWVTERLQFLDSFMTQADIARETSIPQSTLSYAMRGERELPVKYNPSLRNLYQRTAYAELRGAGLSSTQSRRFSWYSPDKIFDVLNNTKNLVSRIVDIRLEQYMQYLESIGQPTTEDAARQILEEAVEKSISKSDLPEERLAALTYGNTTEL